MSTGRACVVFCCLALAGACATPSLPPPPEAPEETVTLPREEQDKRAFALFQELYDYTAERSRQEAVPRIIETYQAIIRDYPQAGLVQEAYMKLVLIHLEEVDPPDEAQAEAYYGEMRQRYPQSPLRGSIESSMMRYYYRAERWEKLLGISAPLVKKELERPHRGHLFYYAEANFQLGRSNEAVRAYRLIIEKAPTSSEARFAKRRLQQIREDTAAGQ